MNSQRMIPTGLILLLALVPVVLSTGGCGGGEPPSAATGAAPAPVVVETATAAYREVPQDVVASGGVEPWVQVAPGTKILGRIDRVPVREGDRVRRGQLLAELESRDLAAAVHQAEAATAMAEAQLEQAAAQRHRMETLHPRGSVTDKNLEDAVAAHRVAEAAVAQAEANLAAARVTLGYAEVRSPVDGWVVAKRASPGDMASPGVPLFTVEDLSKVKVAVEVPESGVVGLAEGDAAQVTLDVLGESFDAEIDRVVPSGDPASRTFTVKLVLDNPEGRIKSGMFARARFARGSRQALVVPGSALVERGQLTGLFVVDQGTARLRWVRTGRTLDDGVEVLSGLETGERYVTTPPPGLTDGAPVEEG